MKTTLVAYNLRGKWESGPKLFLHYCGVVSAFVLSSGLGDNIFQLLSDGVGVPTANFHQDGIDGTTGAGQSEYPWYLARLEDSQPMHV